MSTYKMNDIDLLAWLFTYYDLLTHCLANLGVHEVALH